MVAAVLVAFGASDAMAQGEDFNSVVGEAMTHYRARRYGQAIDKFEQAYALSPQPELVYNIARAYEKSLQRDKAIAAYERFLGLEGTTADLRAKALEALTALRREKVALEKSRAPAPPGPAVNPVPPSGGGAVTRAPAPKSHTLEWVLIGGGAAAAVAGGVFGVLALQANSDFDDLVAAGAERTALEDKKSTVDNNALAADVLIGVGAVSAIAGVIMLLTGDDEPSDVAVSPVFGKDYTAVGFSGSF